MNGGIIVSAYGVMGLKNALGSVLAQQDWTNWLNYSFKGNELWRFGLLLLAILVTLIAARIVRVVVIRVGQRIETVEKRELIGLFFKCLAGPASVAIIAGGLFAAQWCFVFGDEGFSTKVEMLWGKVCQGVFALAFAYFLYRLVDIVEFYLRHWTSKTQTQLDDMLVPIVRKSLRLFIVIVCGLFIADNMLEDGIGPLLATAGVGGLALALAAKDTLANFFGSVTIFADRPFQMGDRIRVGQFDGPVEEVGIRSTRIRTLDGHQVTVPNSMIVNDMVENIGRRPFIKRLANITITYDTPPEKVERALQIIKDVLAKTEEVNRDPELTPKVYFNEFNDCSLNILVIYWVKPPDYWLFQQVNEKVNLSIMRGFQAEAIEFAFPTQTLYVKKEE